MKNHTPGPWQVTESAAEGLYIETDQARGNENSAVIGQIGHCPMSEMAEPERHRDDAKLVAAAPDLKELLIRCYKAIHRNEWEDGETDAELSERINNIMDHHFGLDWHEAVQQGPGYE